MFFSECSSYDSLNEKKWTLENGHCVKYGWIEKKLTDMNDHEKCVLYLKCKLTDGLGVGCDDVTHNLHSLCQNKTINYPLGRFFNPYDQRVYVTNQELQVL
jgi:hypothetical protein